MMTEAKERSNIFIFVLEYKRVELELKRKGDFNVSIEKLIGTVLNRSAMSMVLCSTAECVLAIACYYSEEPNGTHGGPRIDFSYCLLLFGRSESIINRPSEEP